MGKQNKSVEKKLKELKKLLKTRKYILTWAHGGSMGNLYVKAWWEEGRSQSK